MDPPRFDRQAWLCVLIATAVLVPRSWLIMRSHSECIDADYHLRHGLAVLLGNRHLFAMSSTDAPLGQMILALPMAVTGNVPGKPIHREHWPAGVSAPGETSATSERAQLERTLRRGVLYGNAWSPQTLIQLIAVWKPLLFVPAMLIVFQWSRAIFGLSSAWLTQAMILADPNIAANLAAIALDTLAAEAIVIACFCIWRYFERPSLLSLSLASVFSVAAMLIKQTAVIMPGVFLLFAFVYWRADWRGKVRVRINTLATAAFIGLVAIWVLLLFDFSAPADQFNDVTLRPTSAIGQMLEAALYRRWPCGTYIGCFVSGLLVNQFGQPALLYGRISNTGWPYYFEVLMTLKVPIGVWIVIALALVSLLRRPRIRAGEFSILLPLAAWVIFFAFARLNYGFRHFLPAYLFILMWAGRCVADAGRAIKAIAWAGVILAAAHALSFHPDYLSYVNWPYRRPWMQMTDGNIDWGQAMRQIGPWLDAHPQPGRTVHVVSRTTWAGYDGPYYLGDRVHFVERSKPAPRDGILIISPIWVCGVYDVEGHENPFAFLRTHEPIDMIGHSMLVYDLDRIDK